MLIFPNFNIEIIEISDHCLNLSISPLKREMKPATTSDLALVSWWFTDGERRYFQQIWQMASVFLKSTEVSHEYWHPKVWRHGLEDAIKIKCSQGTNGSSLSIPTRLLATRVTLWRSGYITLRFLYWSCYHYGAFLPSRLNWPVPKAL